MKKVLLFLTLLLSIPLLSQVKLPAVFSDHAILKKSNKTAIFGTANPKENITLTFAGQTATTIADANGKWCIYLNLSETKLGPHILKVNNLIINDILVGEVFLASGQSNMAFRLNRAENFSSIKSLPKNNYLRTFNVHPTSSKLPLSDVKGQWIIASPNTVGTFSAVSYFFAKKIQDTLNTPVGIINASVGGTEIECWTSKEALEKYPQVVKEGKKRDKRYDSYSQVYKEFLKKNRAWEKKYSRIDNFQALPPQNVKWKKAIAPVAFGNGIYFLKTKVNIPEKLASTGFKINFMRTYCPVALYIDGKLISTKKDDVAYKMNYFTCNIPKGKLRAGTHEIILRYFVSHDRVRLPRVSYFGNITLEESQWEIFCAKDFGKPNSIALKERPKLPGLLPSRNRLWSRLFNGMIHPLIPYTLSGVIWYQGESNATNAAAYRKLFPEMINNWRKCFNNENLPFFYCQLASFMSKSNNPSDCGNWPLLRDAQKAALKLPNTGMAVLIDAGEAQDIHPIDKATPGTRLAALALKHIYQQNISSNSPMAIKAVRNGNTVTVSFTEDGLIANKMLEYYYLTKSSGKKAKLYRNSPKSQLEGFALCGNDGKWYWADYAEIKGNTVIVSSNKVPMPTKIRYGWMNNPTVNLYSKAGLPAVPFELPVL